MNHHPRSLSALATAMSLLLLTACASAPKVPEGAINARQQLNKLQANAALAQLAPVAIRQADQAVQAAETQVKDRELSAHLVFVADRKVNIAWAQAQDKLAQDERKVLADQRDAARLDSRTREADLARSDANVARADADRARDDASDAQLAAAAAQNDANQARSDAERSQSEAAELQAQIAVLNAKTTERGLVVTLGDVLFDTAQSNLKISAGNHLANLAGFLKTYPDRGVIIEGHTDSVGDSDYNYGLSQRRADSVQSYLLAQGINSSRMSSSGKGEAMPVAGNDSASGRQQNRRVEVIITNEAQSRTGR